MAATTSKSLILLEVIQAFPRKTKTLPAKGYRFCFITWQKFMKMIARSDPRGS
jgi:hypothetical protein